MNKAYIHMPEAGGSFNVDIFPPHLPSCAAASQSRPGKLVVVVCGGGGKDMRVGAPSAGKHGASYHDIGESISRAGYWIIVPSRRGDPQRDARLRPGLAEHFRLRLPEELLCDLGPNEGLHSHKGHVAELKWLVEHLPEVVGLKLDPTSIGILGKSAGCGVALALAAELGEKVGSIALWGAALRTSQWFAGPKADSFFQDVLDKRGVKYHRETFLREMCDAIDFVDRVTSPILFACAAHDPYAPATPELDKWTSIGEQVELMRYAINARFAKLVAIKGAEHTMYAELPAWPCFINTLTGWFQETIPSRVHA